MQSDQLDQRQDLRLRSTQQDRAVADPQAARKHRQVEHQRRVGEDELAQVHDDVRLGPERPTQSATSPALSGAVLIANAPEDRRVVSKLDDSSNLHNLPDAGAVNSP
jgi:hypothetical protein